MQGRGRFVVPEYPDGMDLVDDIKSRLRRHGHAQDSVTTDAEAKAWRAAARTAARQLQRPVQTIQHGEIVVAALRDWPANELEQQVSHAQLRRVANAAASALEAPDPH